MGGTLSMFRKHLSEAMIVKLQDAFVQIDEDSSGTISKAEFTKCTDLDEAAVAAMYSAIDKDASGEVDGDEWVAYFGKLRSEGKSEHDITDMLSCMTQKRRTHFVFNGDRCAGGVRPPFPVNPLPFRRLHSLPPHSFVYPDDIDPETNTVLHAQCTRKVSAALHGHSISDYR